MIVASAVLLGACNTERLTEPTHTATEQLLVSTAVDHAVDKLSAKIPRGTKVFLDSQYFDTGAATSFTKYAIASIRDSLLRQGVLLVDARPNADVIAEIRTGGESIDHHDMLVGIPAIPIPIPLSGTITTPKVPLYERDQQNGIAKIALTAYSKDGTLVTSSGPIYGKSIKEHWVVMLFISGNVSDLLPKPAKH